MQRGKSSDNEAMSHLNDALGSMLNHTNSISLDQRLAAASKKILLQKIEFEPARRNSSLFPLQSLRAKYTPLNAGSTEAESPAATSSNKSSKDVAANRCDDGLPVPSRVLCNPDKITSEWAQGRRVGVGLTNLGNTCFLNATLQCLSYTSPLVNYLTNSNHTKSCNVIGFCMMCELQKHIGACFDSTNGSPIKPLSILQKLRMIAKHMRWGRQEDAHEFLRYVIDALQRANLVGLQKLDQRSKDTCAVNQIFGGYLRSQVMCLTCHENSNTFDPFLDLCMDVRSVSSVESALRLFVQPEILAKDNAYMCARCRRKVTARKTFAIHQAPKVLTIQLKRYGVHGGKVTRHIDFSERLNLRPFMSRSSATDSVLYRLYAVLVHDGSSTKSGHYYCYVCAPGGNWHCMNDSSVYPTSLQRVLQAEAYILFYVQDVPKQPVMNGKVMPVNGLASNKITPSKSASVGSTVSLQRSKSEPCLITKPMQVASVLDEKPRPKNGPALISESPISKASGQKLGPVGELKTGSAVGILASKLDSSPALKPAPKQAHVTPVLDGKPRPKNAPAMISESPIFKAPVQKLGVVGELKNGSAVGIMATNTGSLALKPSHVNIVQNDVKNGFVSPVTNHQKTLSPKPVTNQPSSLICGSNKSGTIISDPANIASTSSVSSATTNGLTNGSSIANLPHINSVTSKITSNKKSCSPKEKRLPNVAPAIHRRSGSDVTNSAVRATTKWRISDVVGESADRAETLKVHATTVWRVSYIDPVQPLNRSAIVNGMHDEAKSDSCNGTGFALTNGEKKRPIDERSSSCSASMEVEEKSKKIPQNIVVQKWDQIVPKGYRTAGVNLEQTVKQSWDGSCQRREYSVAPELKSGIFGFGNGTEVSTWDGSESVLGRSLHLDGKMSKKRSSEEDDEIDQGRVKKVKRKQMDDESLSVVNRFQQHQNFKNMETESKKTGILSLKGR